jgi:hypothetical protein
VAALDGCRNETDVKMHIVIHVINFSGSFIYQSENHIHPENYIFPPPMTHQYVLTIHASFSPLVWPLLHLFYSFNFHFPFIVLLSSFSLSNFRLLFLFSFHIFLPEMT